MGFGGVWLVLFRNRHQTDTKKGARWVRGRDSRPEVRVLLTEPILIFDRTIGARWRPTPTWLASGDPDFSKRIATSDRGAVVPSRRLLYGELRLDEEPAITSEAKPGVIVIPRHESADRRADRDGDQVQGACRFSTGSMGLSPGRIIYGGKASFARTPKST